MGGWWRHGLHRLEHQEPDLYRSPPPPYALSLRRAGLITLRRGALGSIGASQMLDARISREVENDLAVFLEHLPREDLGEEIRWVVLARDVTEESCIVAARDRRDSRRTVS